MNADDFAKLLGQAMNDSAKAFDKLVQTMRQWADIGIFPTYTLMSNRKVRRRRHIVNALNRTVK